MHQKTISIRGMHCRSCEILIEDAICEIPGVHNVQVNFRKGQATIHQESSTFHENEIEQAIKKSGYEIGTPNPLPWITHDQTDWRYIIIGLATVSVLYLFFRESSLFDIALNEENINVGFALMLGLIAGISTCMALVGGLVLGISARHAELHPEATSKEKFRPHLFFNAGRVIGYTIFGGLLGALGGFLQISGTALALLTLVVGIVMMTLGIKLTNISPRLSATSVSLPPSIARLLGLSTHHKEYSHRASLLTGALTFFLPCGFTQAMQLFAISTGDAKTGAIILGAFALGTAPALLGIGGLSSIVKGSVTRIFYAVVGVIVFLFGLYNIQNARMIFPLTQQTEHQQFYSIITNNTNPVPQKSDDQKIAEPTDDTAQVITMTQSGSGYDPDVLRVKVGIPVRWEITSTSSFTCASSLLVPTYNIDQNLKKGLNVIKFTPTEKGSVPFSCSMGMYRGEILVE